MNTAATKQFVEKKPTSGFNITKTRSGYRVERWSSAAGDRTDQVWHVSAVSAKRFNPDGQDWGAEYRPYVTRGAMLLKHCQAEGAGVRVIRQGYEVAR